MPQLDGFQSVEKIIEALKRELTPIDTNLSPIQVATELGLTIVALTSENIDQETEEKIFKCGMRHIFQKPIKSSDIDRLIAMEESNDEGY